MKASVTFLCVAVVSSTHVLEKRSLLGVGQDHKHHEDQHELERTGRDRPVSAPAGYLPPAEDDYDDYDDDSAGLDVSGFRQQGQDNDNQQSQYGQNERSPQSGAPKNSVARQSSNIKTQLEGNQIVKFGQRTNKKSHNTGSTRQEGSRRNQQGGGRRQQKVQRQNQFDLDNEHDGSLGTYGYEVDKEQILNHQQQGGPGSQTRQGNNQRSQGNNSQFDNLTDSNGQSQPGQQSGRDNGGQLGKQGHQNQNGQDGGQSNQQQGQGISLQREKIQFLQGQAKALLDSYGGQGQEREQSDNSQTPSLQFGQGGKSQQQRNSQDNNFGNQQDRPAADSYGAPGTEQSNIKSQNGQDKTGQNQERQDQQGENQTGQIQRRLNHTGQNQRGQNQSGHNQRGQNQRGQNQRGQNQRGHTQRGQNQRGQNQRGQNQRGQNQRGQNLRGQNQRGQNQRGQNEKGKHQGGQNQGDFINGNGLRNQQIHGESANDSYGAPGQGQGSNKAEIGHQRGQIQRGDNLREQNQGGLIQGNGFGDQQVQCQSADESYSAPGQGSENNKFQIAQGQKKHNQNIQNQRASAFPSQFGTSGTITSTINRFLPASRNNANVNSGHGAPQLSEQTGLNFDADKSGPSIQRSQVGSDRNSNTVSQFAGQGAQQRSGTHSFPFPSSGSRDFELKDTLICPGGTVETCIKVCPGNTAKLYGGCVQGCADRCDDQGQGAQFGQQVNSGQGAQIGQQGNSGQGAQFEQQGNSGQGAQFGQQGNSGQGAQFEQQGNPGQGAQFGEQGNFRQSAQFGEQGNPGQGAQFGQQGNTRQSQGVNVQSLSLESQGQDGEDQQGQYGQHND